MKSRARGLAIVAAALLAGCAYPTRREERPARAAPDGLVAGTTTREDMVVRFGVPCSVLHDGRTLSWGIARRLVSADVVRDVGVLPEARTSAPDYLAWYAADSALVAEFDDRGTLARWTVVQLRDRRWRPY
jgi:hypothetical protein